jgi:hypothetical protein
MVGPLNEGIERPGVRVIQQFEGEAATVVRPILQAVIVGESYQIVTKGEAGVYAGAQKTFNYPDLIAGSTVLTTEVKVYLTTVEDEFEITSDTGVTISASGVDIDDDVLSAGTFDNPEKFLTENRKISLVTGDTIETSGTDFFFTDSSSDFVIDNVKPGDVLRFVQSSGDLELNDTQVSALNTSDYKILEVVSKTKLRLDAALTDEDRLEYNFLRIGSTAGDVTISYRARRKDGVDKYIEARDLDEVEAQLGPAVPENPLAYGMALALANTRNLVAGTMVELDSTDDFQKALDFLESKESAYALVPLTTNPVVHQAFQQHVNFMSEPNLKSERIVFIAPQNPDEEVYQTQKTDADLVGLTATTSRLTSASATFLTNEVPVGSYIEIDSGSTSIPQIGAQNVLIWQVAAVESETQLIVLGVPDSDITTSDITYEVNSGAFSKLQLARNAAARGAAFGDRRVFYIFPETAKSIVSQSEQTVASYYIGAALSGLVSSLNPSQGFTNISFAGFTEVVGSNDFFGREDLNTIAGGGVMIVIQESLDGPLTIRHQLSTDVSTIERRELSITKAVDYTAKFIRTNLSPLIGINNITTNFLNNVLKPAVQGILRKLIEDNVIGPDTRIISIRQSASQPDTVEVDVRMDVLYPVNYIDVTLII